MAALQALSFSPMFEKAVNSLIDHVGWIIDFEKGDGFQAGLSFWPMLSDRMVLAFAYSSAGIWKARSRSDRQPSYPQILRHSAVLSILPERVPCREAFL